MKKTRQKKYAFILAIVSFAILTSESARGTPIDFDFHLYGTVLTPTLGFGDFEFNVTYNSVSVASGSADYDGVQWTSSGMLSGIALPPRGQWGVIDVSFTRTFDVDPTNGGQFGMTLNANGVRMPIDFANRFAYASAPPSSGRQGLTVIALRGGSLEFISDNTELFALASNEGNIETDIQNPPNRADILNSASSAPATAYAWVTGVTDGLFNVTAFPSAGGFPDDLIYDLTKASIGVIDPTRPNIRLISGPSSIPEPNTLGLFLPGVALLIAMARLGWVERTTHREVHPTGYGLC
ncbi:hypothetical protein EV699_11168 [Plasticicumulans lactativorans]|uniref:Secreted protein with PEP-CTERM sorting signal n=1 Tax=Plasticicumulans lactativorans TaxID=1133106 RepID=A0A4R2L6G1_9GAMM|nr:hypothetical protein [Plasticicumulans lactativorans]TCO80867.1 hypothetical protein EV699_11168 [Plasticicumulans lactativorans]